MNTPRQRAVTIRDVARAAAVSTATVSKFVNGGKRFTVDVEARITRAVTELGWSMNPMARGINTGQTGNVGIVILDICNPHFTSMVKGATRAASAAGLNLLFADAAESKDPVLAVTTSLSRRVDGLIVSARLPRPVLDALFKTGMPVVFYGGPAPHEAYHSVCCDNYSAGRMLGRHLRDAGHRSISYIGFPVARWSAERWRGIQDAFDGVDSVFRQFEASVPDADEGARLASLVLLSEDMPDAVVTFNDLLALGFLAESKMLGIRVPEQVSVAGFDNIAYGRYASPTLTSVDMMSEAVGDIAMRRLVGLIRGNPIPCDDVLTSRLVVRESTGRHGPGRKAP